MSRQKYHQQVCATLPPALGVKIAKFEKTKLFTEHQFKVMTTISTKEKMLVSITVMFDTGTGSNLIREDVLPTPSLVDIQSIHVSVKAAGDTAFRVEGVFRLLVEMGRYKAEECFTKSCERSFRDFASPTVLYHDCEYLKSFGTPFKNTKVVVLTMICQK